jgi:hypothetical protein
MEEEGIGSIIYYVVIAVVTLLSIVAGRRKKKAQQQPVPAESFPEIPDNPEDYFPRKKEEESLTDLLRTITQNERQVEEKVMIDYNNYDETRADHSILKKKKPVINEIIEEESSKNDDFDPVKAIIYSEIMNRKYS